MVDSFKEELLLRLSTLPTKQKYFIYDLGKPAEPCTSLFPQRGEQNIQLIHRLILVATAKEVEEEQQLISGLEVYEYLSKDTTLIPERTIYISKIDSTGSGLGKGVTRRLVQAYIASQKHQTTNNNNNNTNCRIHVFARAQPQYLFPHSAKDKSKRILDDRQLVGWWHTTLGDKSLYDDQVKPYWIIPGVDEKEAQYDIGIGKDDDAWWYYGSPYSPQAQAKDVIPRFDDDGKARYLGSVQQQEDGLTVEDFWTLFGYSEECGAGKLTGIFMVDSSCNSSKKTTGEILDQALPLEEEDHYTRFWNYLMDLDFCDDQANLTSTKKLLKKWKSILSPRCFMITTEGKQKRSLEESSLLVTETPTVNVLLPKRRKVEQKQSLEQSSLATEAPIVNVLVPKRRKVD